MYTLQSGLCVWKKSDMAQQSHIYLKNSKTTVSYIN